MYEGISGNVVGQNVCMRQGRRKHFKSGEAMHARDLDSVVLQMSWPHSLHMKMYV